MLDEQDPASGDPRRLLEGVDDFQFVSLIGSGAMGCVIKALDIKLGTYVAIKFLLALDLDPIDQAQAEQRMTVEAQTCFRLTHPNLLKAIRLGVNREGRTYIVSEFLEGRTLRAELEERGHFPVAEAIAITISVLSGLDAAHAIGVVHRDIKPDNLFRTSAPAPLGGLGVKVLDFGLAKVVDASRDPNTPAPLGIRTSTGAMLGTPKYMAPEQVKADREVDYRADIYSVGTVLYVMLVGNIPFAHRKGIVELYQAQLSEEPPPPSRHAQQPIPFELDRAVLKALEKDPTCRRAPRNAGFWPARFTAVVGRCGTA